MDDPLPPNPYKTLNVPKDATLAIIRSAHRKLVLSCHPDKVQEESAKKIKAEQFHQVQTAYEILSDEKKRQRYDEKVKLEELRAEMAKERDAPLPRRATDYDYGPPRGGFPPMRDMYQSPIYETREPKNARYSDEDYPSTRYDIRPPAKSYDDYFTASAGRRTSGRGQEDKKKTRDFEDDRERRRREKEEAYIRDQRTKQRTKQKRSDTENKSKGKFSPYTEEGSDSEYEDRRYTSKRDIPSKARYEEPPTPRRSREEPRKNSKYDPRYDDELEWKLSAHQEHINKSRETVEIDPHRTGRSRASSDLRTRKKTPPPQIDSSKRPPVRRGSRQPSPVRSSKKDRRTQEIVDAPPSRKTSIPDSKGIKSLFSSNQRREPQRAATHEPSMDFKPPPVRRSDTTPIRSSGPQPSRSANLQNMKAASVYSSSSDSESEMTDDVPIPIKPSLKHTATSYRVHNVEDKLKSEPQEIFPPRQRESPPRNRHSSDRPAMAPRGSTTRAPTTPRATTYTYPKDERSPRPGISRAETLRPTPKPHQSNHGKKLFREQSPDEEIFKPRPPRAYADDVRYSGRRGSEEVERDAYPGSRFHSRRPTLGRNETAY